MILQNEIIGCTNTFSVFLSFKKNFKVQNQRKTICVHTKTISYAKGKVGRLSNQEFAEENKRACSVCTGMY